MHHGTLRLILLAGMILALTACGSSRSDEDGVDLGPEFLGVDENGIGYIGSDRCISCHDGLGIDAEQVDAYLGSPHVIHSTAINAASSAFCLNCHDPLGDGVILEGFIDPVNVPENGLAAISCESCHGAGGEHFGVGPLPRPTPDFKLCGECHTSLPSGPAAHAGEFANGILEDYTSGVHAATLQGRAFAVCSRCHSDEGFRRFAQDTAGFTASQISAVLAGATPPADPSTVQCRTCHDSHSGELRSTATTAVPDGATVVQYSRQFNLCTTCHQVFLTADFDAVSQAFTYELDRARLPFHGTAGNPLDDPNSLLIWDTHFASPADGISGYGINAADEEACTSCHHPHSGSLE